MKVLFSEIPESGRRIEILDDLWYPEDEPEQIISSKVLILLAVKDCGVSFDCELKAELKVDCDLCLEPYNQTIDTSFNILFKYAEDGDPYKHIEDHVCSESDLNVIYLEKPELEIHNIIQQQYYLTVPPKKVCSENCRGLCSKCGNNLNISKCTCADDNESSPFHVLKKLKQ